MPDLDKNISGDLFFDFGKWRRYVRKIFIWPKIVRFKFGVDLGLQLSTI